MKGLFVKWGFRALVVLVFLGIAFMLGRKTIADEKESYENIIRNEQFKAKVWKDNAEHWHLKTEAAEVTSRQALKHLSKYDAQFASLQTSFESVNKNLRNLQAAAWTGSTSTYNITTTLRDTVFSDSVRGRVFDVLDTSGWCTGTGFVRDDKLNLDLVTRDSVDIAFTRKRRLFRRSLYFAELKSKNPHTRITYSRAVVVNKKR